MPVTEETERTNSPSSGVSTVNFTLLDEVGEHDVLLFGCKGCPDRKLTSFQLEQHMKVVHNASKFTVDAPSASRNRSRKREVLWARHGATGISQDAMVLRNLCRSVPGLEWESTRSICSSRPRVQNTIRPPAKAAAYA